MIPIKIECACGQHYAFDIEPVNGRMPSPVACPVCGADGTPAANEIIARSLAAQPAAAPGGIRLSMPAGSAAPAVAPSIAARLAAAGPRPESEGEKWKWWYFVLAGVCIGGYSIWQAYTQHRIKPLGELFLAVFCIAVGIWDFQHKRKKKRSGE